MSAVPRTNRFTTCCRRESFGGREGVPLDWIRSFAPGSEVYCLAIRHEASEQREIGALGTVDWPAGWVYYVGRSSRGWVSRVRRLLLGEFTPFWHVDYLLRSPRARLVGVRPFRCSADRECVIAARVAEVPGASPLCPGFGASDCESSCEAHGWLLPGGPEEVFVGPGVGPGNGGWLRVETDRWTWVAGRGDAGEERR